MSESVLSLFERRVNLDGAKPALRARGPQGWAVTSWRHWWERAERAAAGLITLGLDAGQRVALLARSRQEWLWADMAIMMAGAISAPLYPSTPPALLMEQLRRCEASVIIAEDPSLVEALASQDAAWLAASQLVVLDAEVYLHQSSRRVERSSVEASLAPLRQGGQGGQGGVLTWAELEALGRRALAADAQRVARRRRAVSAADVATLVYTSGTTAAPLAAILTHANLVAQLEAIGRLDLLRAQDVHLLGVPLAHSVARVAALLSMRQGAELALSEGLDAWWPDAREVQPTVATLVPLQVHQLAHELGSSSAAWSAREPASRLERAAWLVWADACVT